MNCAGYYLWIVHPAPFKNTHTSRGRAAVKWSVAAPSFDSEAESCERVTGIKGSDDGHCSLPEAQPLQCGTSVWTKQAQCSGEGIKKVFMRLCSLCELRWLWLKQQQQRAAGVKSCAARMSIPACQELSCAPVFWISKKKKKKKATYII